MTGTPLSTSTLEMTTTLAGIVAAASLSLREGG